MEIEEEGLEFEALVQELCPDVSATEYVNFDVNIPAFGLKSMSIKLIGDKNYEKIALTLF